MQGGAGRSLRREVARATRQLIVLAAVSIVFAVVAGVVLVSAHDDGTRFTAAAQAARVANDQMLEELTAVRGFLLGGSADMYRGAPSVGVGVVAADAELMRAIGDDEGLRPLAVDVRAAAADWRSHARSMVHEAAGSRGDELDRFLIRDQELFDAYRASRIPLVDALLDERQASTTRERRLLIGAIAVQVAVLGGLVVTGLGLRRRLRLGVVEPVADLEQAIARMADGDLGARVAVHGYDELAAAGTGLASLADTLSNEQVRARLRADLLALQAERFRELLHTSQEISGTPDVAFVVGAVEASALRVTGWPRAVVRVDDRRPVAAADQIQVAGGRATFPMVVGGAVNGAIELESDDAGAVVPTDVVEVLTVLASQAAAAVESARLHARLADESRRDALTGLPNRRSLDEDLETELARCERYQRPMTVVLVDLDHFKLVNDRYGHGVGDDVLHGTAELLQSMLRATDTAYRYGGEELVLLLRDTSLDAAAEVAERLRAALERHNPAGIPVTGSFGAADVVTGDTRETILDRADAALYQAKHAGRNRVVLAGRSLVLG